MFEDLYKPRGWGDWMSDHQGLSRGMDLLDWMRFINRACDVIRMDRDAERRIWKAKRLHCKAMKVMGQHRSVSKTPYRIQQIIQEAELEIEARQSARLQQLSLWIEAIK
jgi:hypothetical protein